MKKVLLLGPPPSSKGGVTIWMKIVLDYLQEHPQENVHVVHLPIARSVSLTHLLPIHKRLYYSIKDYAKGLRGLVKHLRKGGFDKIHLLSSLGAGIVRDWLYVKVARFYRVKPIVHYHCGTLPSHLASNGWMKKLLISTLKSSYKSIILDDGSYKVLAEAGFNNVVKIGNSFNSEIEVLENIGIKRNEKEILFVGHNVREKGIFELLEAIAPIEGVLLKIYGPQDEIIQKEIDKWLQLNPFKGEVNFMGLRPSNEIFRAMRQASLFVLPTYTEGFPYVIVEAMASGCPIITTPVGAIEEMLYYKGESQGYLVEPRNVGALHEQIVYCLSHRVEIKSKVERAKEKAYSEYSTDAVMRKFINLWNG